MDLSHRHLVVFTDPVSLSLSYEVIRLGIDIGKLDLAHTILRMPGGGGRGYRVPHEQRTLFCTRRSSLWHRLSASRLFLFRKSDGIVVKLLD